MNSNRIVTFTVIAAAAAVTAIVGYAAYFDHKRRSDPGFRKELRRQQKKAHRLATNEAKTTVTSIPREDLLKALQELKKETIPTSAQEKEAYFSQNIGMAEQLCMQGDAFHLPAALSFYRALRVYPNPMELILLFQRMVPEPILKLVMEMWSHDPAHEKDKGYYDHFPKKDMNVSVKSAIMKVGENSPTKKDVLIITKDVEVGEVIYKEDPIITVLDPDLESVGSHCSQCLRKINPGVSIRLPDDPLQTSYCSQACQTKARLESYGILFGSEPPIPDTPPPSATDKKLRTKAQEELVSHLRKGKTAPLLVARLIAKQLAEEIANVSSNSVPNHSTSATSEKDYNLYDHIERLRYLALPVDDEETALLSQILKTSVPGLEQMLTSERYAIFKGKILYNAIGVCFGEGRDKPSSNTKSEDERTRTMYGTDRQTGSGLYLVSSYLAHSCSPSARPSFPEGTSTLHLIANHALKKGDELTIAYVDILQREGETTQEAHLRRRRELAHSWRFACTCRRCLEEISAGDESKVEIAVQRYGENNMDEPSLVDNDIQD
ncbi:MAS20-domain-containing protein [Hysterangium stoloniferum]|nr:MAS20-domain-containing protein [Hysterangium stoloniferum]